MNRTKLINELLQQFDPIELLIENQSASHAGHGGDDGSGETHFHVVLASAQFVGLSRLAAHRAVMTALEPAFKAGVHAITLSLRDK